jgi:hypothetical protein
MVDENARLHRQLEAVAREMPATRRFIHSLLHGSLRLLRIPAGIFLVIGGVLSVLPVLGLWMLPLGLLLLAVDIPFLRPLVARLLVRARRRITVLRQSRSSERY